MNKYLDILGREVEDRVTGFIGVATSVSFDLYGCVQVIVTPPREDDGGKLPDSGWFDHKRLKTISDKPVMDLPTFASVPGGAKLPLPSRNPMP